MRLTEAPHSFFVVARHINSTWVMIAKVDDVDVLFIFLHVALRLLRPLPDHGRGWIPATRKVRTVVRDADILDHTDQSVLLNPNLDTVWLRSPQVLSIVSRCLLDEFRRGLPMRVLSDEPRPIFDRVPPNQTRVSRVGDDAAESLVFRLFVLDPIASDELIVQLSKREREALRHVLLDDRVRSTNRGERLVSELCFLVLNQHCNFLSLCNEKRVRPASGRLPLSELLHVGHDFITVRHVNLELKDQEKSSAPPANTSNMTHRTPHFSFVDEMTNG